MKNIYALALLLLGSPPVLAAGNLQIYVLNVDLGNAVLVVSPSGQSMLLDAGPPEKKYLDRILAAISDAGLKQIDYVVISHYHWDHYGTIPELAKQVPIRNYVDHGDNVEVGRSPEFYRIHGGGPRSPQYDAYVKARDKGNHIVAKPGEKIGALSGHTAAIEAVALSRDGRWLASGSDDNTAKLWRLSDQNSAAMVLPENMTPTK